MALVLLLIWAVRPARAQQQEDGYLTVVVAEGQLLRDVAAEYLDDPDLWPQILEASGLASQASVRPGVTLRIPKTQVTLANDALRRALETIQEATGLGARVFAADTIGQALRFNDEAKIERQRGEWRRCRELADQARTAAGQALAETRRQRDAAAEAVLDSRSGRVESRRSEALEWASAAEGAVLVEKERIRTLSESRARVLFADESRLDLGPDSQAVIQKMRMDLLDHRQEATVSLTEGDVYALLAGSSKRRPVEVQVPGVKTDKASKDFWVSRKGGTTKIANYDDAAMVVESEGGEVALGRNQGTMVEDRAAPTDPRDLPDAPELAEPADDHLTTADAVVLGWREVPGARSYKLEVAQDAAFSRPLISRSLAGAGETLEALAEGDYYWRVAAIDDLGFPGAKSPVRRFRVRPDRAAPYLAVRTPADGAILRESPARVTGEAESGAAVTVNGAAAELEADGAFAVDVPLAPGVNAFVFEVRDAGGNLTRRERTATYMPDRPAAVDYEDAPGETGLARIGEASFLTRRQRFVLGGRTVAGAALEVVSTATGATARASAGDDGAFRVHLELPGEHDEFRLLVTSPSGHVSEERLTVTRDDTPPVLAVDDGPPEVTGETRIRLSGRVTGSDRLTLNGDEVAVDGEAFAASYDLSPGENRLELTARDRAGNEARWQETVVLDREAPELVDHAVSPRDATGGDTVEVTVRAADASGLKRTASFTLRLGPSTVTGTLLLDGLSGTYRGTLVLPDGARGPATLQAVELEDYNGNRRTYHF